MALSTTGKMGLAAALGGGSAILVNGILRSQCDVAKDSEPNPWFYYAPWISLGGVAAATLATYYLMGKSKDAALVCAIAGALAAVAVPANDYALTEIRETPVTNIPVMEGARALKGSGHLARAVGRAA
jgi:hypothetical protein